MSIVPPTPNACEDGARRRISTRIWLDPEFTSMTRRAQLLWFALQTSRPGRNIYRRHRFMSLTGMSKDQIRKAEREIRQRPKYASAFAPYRYRPAIPKRVRRAVFERDNFECQECGATESLSLDHIVPYSHGGPDTVENLRVLCIPCNSRKGNRI